MSSVAETRRSRRSADDPWSRYERFSDALSQQFFAASNAGAPVYLDMDDEVLELAGKSLLMTGAELQRGLIEAVRSCLYLGSSGPRVFQMFDTKVMHWRREYLAAVRDGLKAPLPPVVGLLAVFTIAAERMGESNGGKFHDNAYYPRLTSLLDVSGDDEGRFKQSFRDSSEAYWDALRAWLEQTDGVFGLPSAYALSHRYIGLPISQALIRDKERRQLVHMFDDMGLPVGTGVSQGDMEIALDQWISQVPSPASASLRQLWSRGDARSRIVDIALVALEAWDGLSEGGSSSRGLRSNARSRCILAISDRRSLFENQLEVAVAVPKSAGLPDFVALTLVDGATEVSLSEIGTTHVGFVARLAGVDTRSLLEGLVTITGESSPGFTRTPRSVVPMLRDSMANVYFETERLLVGENMRLLVEDDGARVSLVDQILGETARPGFNKSSEKNAGIPEGWVLYSDIQLLASPREELVASFDLNPMIPRLSTQMGLSGGFKVPGRIQKWSVLAPPQLLVASDEAAELSVSYQRRDITEDTPGGVTSLAASRAPFVVDIEALKLEAGDYTFALNSGTKILQTHTLRLRSGDSPDQFSWNKMEMLQHHAGDPLWPLMARAAEDGFDTIVDGALSVGDIERPALSGEASSRDSWAQRPQAGLPAQKLIQIPRPGQSSCIVTGAHRIKLPTFDGKPLGRYVFGTCSECGLTKRSPAQFWDKALLKRSLTHLEPTVHLLAPVPKATDDWRAAIDVVMHVGTGSALEIEKIARQIEDSALFVSNFVSVLEALGVIEIARDSKYRVTSWEVAGQCAAELDNGDVLLTGYWSDEYFRESVERPIGLSPGMVNSTNLGIRKVPQSHADALASLSENEPFAFVQKAGLQMLETLPPLRSLLSSLPRREMPVWTKIDFFDRNSATWQPSVSDGVPGAYRLRSLYESTYVFRGESEIANNEAIITSPELAKHLAAAMASEVLVSYDKVSRRLSVPFGAELPGLYGRAAVLCSGELPSKAFRRPALEYFDIDQQFANIMTGLLSGEHE